MIELPDPIPLVLEQTLQDVLAAEDLANALQDHDEPHAHAIALHAISRILNATSDRLQHFVTP